MEESKDRKESGYNKKHWWEGGPMSYETLEEKAEHWTLGADAATATLLQQISSKMIARTHEVEAALKNVCEDVDDLHVSLSNVATSLHLLSNMQFTENRTYQEDESTRVDSASTNIKAEKCALTTQEDLMSSCCQAIAEGLDLVKNSYMKMEISDSESEGGEEGQKKGMLTVYKRLNPYENHKLPHLIGSSNFYTDDTLGLIDVDEEEDRQINDEKWSTTSSVCSGDGKKDNHLLPSLPIVANSSKMEDEDSDSDGSFILSSKEMSKREVKSSEQYPSAEQVSLSSDHSNKKVNAIPSSLQPNSNGVLLDSDEDFGPIFGPPKDSYITHPPHKQHIDSEPLFRSDLKKPELSHTNLEKERLFRGIHEPNREGSKLFDFSDSDEDGLFSSKMNPKPSGTSKSTYVKPQIENREGGTERDENEETKEDTTNQGLKDDKTLQTSESDLQGRHKKPVGGINIFNAAITKAIEKQHLSGSNRENSAESNGSKNVSNEKTSKTGSVSNEKEEERGLFIPKPNANSHIINNTSSKVTTVSSNYSKKKSLSTSLFSEDDDDDLFRPPRPHVSRSAQSTVIPGGPILSKSKSLDSNSSISVKSKMDQRATTLDSIFGDSDDDLFTSVKKAQSTRTTSVVASNYQTEPPPLPQSLYSSSLSDKKGSITKKVKSKVGIFSSSSSDDDIFTPRKPSEKYLGVNKPGIESSFNPPRQELSNPPHTVDVENPYLRSADLVTNPEHSNIPTLDKSSNTSSDSSSKLSTKRNELIPQNHPSVMSKTSQKKSLFGSSDEDDDDIFTPKSKKINAKNKVLTSTHSDEPSSSNVLKKPDSSKKVIDDTTSGKTVMNGNKELSFKKDVNPITLADNTNIESDSSEDEIFKSSKEKISKPKDTLTKFGKTEQSESDTLQFGRTVSDSSILPRQRTSSQNDKILSKQNKITLSDANDIFNDSSDVDIFSDFKSESSTRHCIKSDKPATHIDSSDDNLFSNKNSKIKTESESNKVQILSGKLGSDDLFSSNEGKDDENLPKKTLLNEFTKTKDFDSNNVYGISNNDTKKSLQKKNKPGKNLFSSDSDEDIFSTIKTNIHRKGAKDLKIFSDSDDNDDIFSTNFKSKHKLGDNVDKNFGGQTPKLGKTELPKSADTKDEISHSHIKPAKMPKPVVPEPIMNKREKPSAVGENEITKSHSLDQPKVNLSTDNSTEITHKSSLTKSIFDDDEDDLFTSPKSRKSPTVTEEKALKSSTEKSKQVEKDLTDGITSSIPKQTLPKIEKENNAKYFKSEHASEKKSVGVVPHFLEKDRAGEASLFKGDSLSQSLSQTRNISGGLPLVKDDGPSLSSTKKPVGGVALFGGEELLSKLKSRRKSLSSESENNDDNEGVLSKDKSSNITGSLPLRNKSVEDKANKISPNQITSPKIRHDTLVSGSVSNQNFTPSISEEASVSFDSEQRASDLLVNLNKDRPKIQHDRKLPSRLKKNVKEVVKTSDITDYAVNVPESNNNNKDETYFKEAPDSLSSRNKVSFENFGNEGKISTVSNNDNPLLESKKNITVENNSKFICENDKCLDSKTKPVPKQENFHQNTENSFKISENKKSTENEFLSSKNKNSSSSIDASRKIEPSLGFEAQGNEVVCSETRTENTKEVKTNIHYSKEENLNENTVPTSEEKPFKKSSLKIFDDDNDDDDIFSSTKSQSDILPKNLDTNLSKKVSLVEKHLNVDDIFNDGESEKKEISVRKMSKPSANIFGDDDEDIDTLFNASTNKKSNKSTESVKTEAKRPVEIRKVFKPSSSIFSDDDDEDDDSIFSSTSSSLKKGFAPPKVKTGKTTTKQLSIFNDDDDDDSESELFSGAISDSVSKKFPPKTDSYHKKTKEKETQKSFPSKSTLSKERTFVDPLMGDQS